MTRRRKEDGAVAVEFALILPILLMIVFAIISFGLLFAQDLALGNAARQAARYGVIQGRSCDTLVTEAQGSAKPLITLASTDVTVKRGNTPATAVPICTTPITEPCEGSVIDDNIYVTLNYEADVLVPVFPGMGSTMNLDGEGVFRCEFS